MKDSRLLFLGTGTSDGVPLLGCGCEVCLSDDFRNRRLRSSVCILLQCEEGEKQLLIDSSMDFRHQLLYAQQTGFLPVIGLDAIFYTHAHSDHLLGLADVRPLSCKKELVLYADERTEIDIRRRFDYFFDYNPIQQGGGIPRVTLIQVKGKPIDFFGVSIIPIPVMHGKLSILGWRIGNLAYLTDASFIPESSFRLLEGVDTLILNALREKPHGTHFSLSEAIEVAKRIGSRQTYFVHICHSISHEEMLEKTPENMQPAYDGLAISFQVN